VTTSGIVEHLFRHQAGRMVSHFARLLGPAHLDFAEDAVQEAMVRALETWPMQGVPENATAWLFRVAHNVAIDAARRKKLLGDKTEAMVAELSRSADSAPGDPTIEEELRDDELRMLFMCCHPALTRDSSVALGLKTVSGFSVREISRAFLSDETAIAQRLVRAKRQLREAAADFEMPRGEELKARLTAVLDVLYFMFNEGYSACEGEDLIRRDLCHEALRLAGLITASSITTPRVDALAALMAFQAARLDARVDAAGDLVLLEVQDRSKWDDRLVALGFWHFNRSIGGDDLSEFHVQAAIAATHARARSAEEIDWAAILEMYDQLLAMNGSPVVALNRAVALAKVQGAAAGLAALDEVADDPKLGDYHLLLAVRGHLLAELGRTEEAAWCYRSAIQRPCSIPERRFLERKLKTL
jgi:RNA polymerase sigma-70 factor (ECF subfamily)